MTDQSKVATAVVGVGYVGKFHAEKYAASEKASLVAVADIDKGRAESVASQLGVTALTDYRELLGRVQCVSVAVPTRLHFEIASYFLERGVDVLVEKPIAVDIQQGRELVDLAGVKGLILQVGHLERFNPAIRRPRKCHSRTQIRGVSSAGAVRRSGHGCGCGPGSHDP